MISLRAYWATWCAVMAIKKSSCLIFYMMSETNFTSGIIKETLEMLQDISQLNVTS